MLTELLKLFLSFVKIGFTSFGGISMIPLISEEVIKNGWMVAAEVSDIVAIAEMTPGPLGLNCATFAGIKAAGFPGAVAANLGVLMPSFTICALAAYFFEHFKNSRALKHMLTGIRPACLGLIGGIVVSMGLANYFPQGSFDPIAMGLGVFDLFLLLKMKLGIPKLIGINALLGVIIYYFL